MRAMPIPSLQDKVVIITGAGGGIGAATARLFAKMGARLVLTGHHIEKVDAVDLGPAGAGVLRLQHDVADPASWHEVVARTIEKHGRIDVLVNNAGVVVPGRADELPLADVERQVAVNLLGTMYGCRAVLPSMRSRRSGKIVNVASFGGVLPMPFESVYTGTKFGVRGYSLGLHAELAGSGVGVCVFCPDSVETRQLRQELEHDDPSLSFLDRPLSPEKTAEGILHAVETRKPEILLPAGMGLLSRISMAFPRLVLLFMPMLLRMSGKKRAERREQERAMGAGRSGKAG
jgi:NADP-dependent 3-hydroxy acid dehydrogenase YdfG